MNKRLLASTVAAMAVGIGIVSIGAADWKAPRTPWGDPNLSGVYSNDDETGTPMERPAEFAGRRLEDITPAEMKKINQQRTEQFDESVAGTEFAGGLRPPTHLIFDSFERKNSRAWLVTDPPDGKIPALTPEAQQVIHAVADAARRHERSDVIIDGIAHRDNGSALASRRAAAVASALRRAGVAETMVSLRTGLDADGSRFAGDGAPAGQVARSAD